MSNPTLSGSLPEYLLQLSILQLVTASAPFSHTRTAPVHALAHLAADYIHLLASTAKHAAEHAGRTHVSVWDVGRALQEFGPGSLGELTVEAEAGRRRRRLGRGAEEVEAEGAGVGDVEVEVDAAERIGELAKGMSDSLDVPAYRQPIAQLSFQRLTEQEIVLIDASRSRLSSTPGSPSSTSSHRPLSDDDEPVPAHPDSDESMASLGPKLDDRSTLTFDAYPPALASPVAPVRESDEGGDDDDDDDGCQWRDRSLIPPYILPFLPPFPGHEKRGALSEAARRKRDREEQEAAFGGIQRVRHDAPFEHAVPYAQSQMALAHGPEDLPPLSPEAVAEVDLDGDGVPRRRMRRRRRSVEAEGRTDSLQWYRDVAGAVLQDPPVWPLKQNKARRQAATVVGMPRELITGDSLFGNVPLVGTRSATLTAGFLQDGLAHELHPFNTPLPHTVSHTIPLRPSPYPLLMAAPAHNRMPGVVAGLADFLGGSGSDKLSVFSRMLRMGPPGPLDAKGEPAAYDFVGQSNVIDLNVDWQERSYDQRLPDDGGDGGAGMGGGGVGLKLKLPAGRGGTASAAGSPAPWMAEGTGTPRGHTPALLDTLPIAEEALPELPPLAPNGLVSTGADPSAFATDDHRLEPAADPVAVSYDHLLATPDAFAVKQKDEMPHGLLPPAPDAPAEGEAGPAAFAPDRPEVNADDSYDANLIDMNDPAHWTPADVEQPLPDVGEDEGEGDDAGSGVDPVLAFMQQSLLAGMGGVDESDGAEGLVQDGAEGYAGYGLGMEVDGDGSGSAGRPQGE